MSRPVGVFAAVALVVIAVGVLTSVKNAGDTGPVVTETAISAVEPTASGTPLPADPTPTATPVPAPPQDGLTAAERELVPAASIITDSIRPKSIVGSGTGLFFAQNIMYRHTVTVYDRSTQLLAVIPDDIVLADWGFDQYPGAQQGSPVEVAFTADGAYAYVSNYQMYGAGFANPGHDACGAGPWDDSFVYRIDTATLEIDQVIKVGAVPKFVAVTPDDRFVLVTNWCSYDMSVIDTASGEEIRRIPIGVWPRGIVVDPAGDVAYVTVMGETEVAVVDLASFEVIDEFFVGKAPRHMALDPERGLLYISLNGEGRVVQVDVRTREILAGVETGGQPRTLTISDDGTALYVVNNASSTVAKVRTDDMAVVQTVPVGQEPIGIYYDPAVRQLWVSNYVGSIMVFDDLAPSPPEPAN